MKQILLSIAIILMVASSKTSSAQTHSDVSLNISSVINGNLKATAVEASISEVNTRAMRDFNRSYKNASDTKWFKSEGGYFASFSSGGTNTKIVYNNKGQRSYSIVSYTESKLNSRIREQVKSTYFDAAIIGVHEFEFDNKTVHVIKMLDQHSKPLTVTVCDGQTKDITSNAKI
jgi:hypothetical protein